MSDFTPSVCSIDKFISLDSLEINSDEIKEIKLKFEILNQNYQKLLAEVNTKENNFKREKEIWQIESESLKKTIENYEDLIKNIKEIKLEEDVNLMIRGKQEIDKKKQEIEKNKFEIENENLKKEIKELRVKNDLIEKEKVDYEKLKYSIFELSIEYDELKAKYTRNLEELKKNQTRILELENQIENDRGMYFKVKNTISTEKDQNIEKKSQFENTKENLKTRNKVKSFDSPLKTSANTPKIDNKAQTKSQNMKESFDKNSPNLTTKSFKLRRINSMECKKINNKLNENQNKRFSTIMNKIPSSDTTSAIGKFLLDKNTETISSETSETNRNLIIINTSLLHKMESKDFELKKIKKQYENKLYSLEEMYQKYIDKLEKEIKNIKENKKKEEKYNMKETYELKIKNMNIKIRESEISKSKFELNLNQRIDKLKEELSLSQNTIENLMSLNNKLDLNFKEIKSKLEISQQENTVYCSQIYLKNIENKRLSDNNSNLCQEIICLKDKINGLEEHAKKQIPSQSNHINELSKIKEEYINKFSFIKLKYKLNYIKKINKKTRLNRTQEDELQIYDNNSKDELKKCKVEIKFLLNQMKILRNEYENKLSKYILEKESLINEYEHTKHENINLKANIANLTFEKENLELKSNLMISKLKSNLSKRQSFSRQQSIKEK